MRSSTPQRRDRSSPSNSTLKGAGDPLFESHEVFVAGGQVLVATRMGTQVFDRFAGRQAVENGVAQRLLTGAEVVQNAGGCGLVEPLQHRVRSSGVDQVVMRPAQFRADVAGVGTQYDELAPTHLG